MYKYEGIELSPSVFADLLITLFAGKQFKRKDAISEVVKYHSSNGGMLNKNEYVSVFKKAVQRLKEYGIQNRGYGIWLLPSEDNTPITIIDSNDDKADAGICSIEKTIGIGDESVYVYYYNNYKEKQLLTGETRFPCKIGRTKDMPLNRIFSQCGTNMPEYPRIALVIKCDNSQLLENAMHSILKVKNRQIDLSPGKEWFMTNPEEIESFYRCVFEGVSNEWL